MPTERRDILAGFNDHEREVALLLASRELIDSIVNHSKLSFSSDNSNQTVRPQSIECRDLISILLIDFITPGPPFDGDNSLLDELNNICINPQLSITESIEPLKTAVDTLKAWLDQDTVLESVWLAEIEKELSLPLKRKEFLYICGNVAKHSIIRLNRVADRLLTILQREDPTITINDAYRAIEDFQTWIMDHVLIYHLSYLSQMLNDIAWGIQDYLLPEYFRSYTVDDQASVSMNIEMYFYDFPRHVTSELGKVYYWNLMNLVRRQPNVKRFLASKYLQGLN